MSEKKAPEAETQDLRELDLDELAAVQGGSMPNSAVASISDILPTKTTDISPDTQSKA